MRRLVEHRRLDKGAHHFTWNGEDDVGTSTIAAAASVMGAGRGLATQTSWTPAARAVSAVISTDDGSGYRPPGA